MKDKSEFLKEMRLIAPSMKVHFIDQANHKIWDNEKILSDLSLEELSEVNLRKQLPNEIILDIEEKYKIDDIKKRLDSKEWNYEVWETGSRGYHIKLVFGNIGFLEIELREAIKNYIIKEFDTDKKLAKENQWMALEWAYHFKSGKQKILIDDDTSHTINQIPNDVIEYCKKELELNKNVSVIQTDEDFKDFLKDPYLDFMLKNKIEDGDRNNILFKNIAIGLVRSGLNKEDIVKIAERIILNCPGKNIGEFMGWVDKALLGDMKEYNKSEMIQWSLRYNQPVLYKLVSDETMESLMDIKMLWDALWSNKITEQPIWKDLCFYNMLSTIIDEREEDYRIHTIFSSYSSTGKDEGINLVKEILDELNYKCYKPSEVTDRTMVGAVNQSAIEFNTKWGLDEGNIMDNKGHKYKDPKEEGLLASADWIAFGESESVFQPGAYNKKLQIILRQAMDKSREVEKGVSGYMLKFFTHTVFTFTTYSMPNTVYALLSNGLFQRALYYNRELSEEEEKKIREHIINNKFNKIIKDEKSYKALMIKKLKDIKIWYQANRKFNMFEGGNHYINNLLDNYEKQYNVLLPQDKKIMGSIVRRASNNLYKLVVLRAIYNQRNDIYKKDVDEAFQLLKYCIDSVKDLTINQSKEKKVILGLLMMLKDESKNTMTVHHELEEKLRMKSTNARTNLIKKVKSLGFITDFQESKFTMLMITDKGREELGEM